MSSTEAKTLTNTSVNIDVNEKMNITVQQEHEKNKTRLIQLVKDKMTLRGIETVVAEGDANCTIVRCEL